MDLIFCRKKKGKTFLQKIKKQKNSIQMVHFQAKQFYIFDSHFYCIFK